MSRADALELAGPRGTTSLQARAHPLAPPSSQIAVLHEIDLTAAPHAGDFDRALAESGCGVLRPEDIEIFQINVGKLCNMTCRHCHVDAGPDRVSEQMDRETAEACLRALDRTRAHTVNITGGAPELNPHFRFLVEEAAVRSKHVIDRCNLGVLLLPRPRDLPEWLGERGVEIVASLPHWRRRGTDSQRGEGTFDASVEALRRLNAAGYGEGDPRKHLTLMANPVGAFLAGGQASLEREWKEGLRREHGIGFDRLITLNNMPISRYLEWLQASGNLQRYMETLVRAFNPARSRGSCATIRSPFPGTAGSTTATSTRCSSFPSWAATARRCTFETSSRRPCSFAVWPPAGTVSAAPRARGAPAAAAWRDGVGNRNTLAHFG